MTLSSHILNRATGWLFLAFLIGISPVAAVADEPAFESPQIRLAVLSAGQQPSNQNRLVMRLRLTNKEDQPIRLQTKYYGFQLVDNTNEIWTLDDLTGLARCNSQYFSNCQEVEDSYQVFHPHESRTVIAVFVLGGRVRPERVTLTGDLAVYHGQQPEWIVLNIDDIPLKR